MYLKPSIEYGSTASFTKSKHTCLTTQVAWVVSLQQNLRTTTSDDYIIETGVPQGSAVGPTLFLIYTADIPTNEQLTTNSFADGTAILSRSRCLGRATTQLASHLLVVERWLSDWRIKINEKKCKYITFTLNRQTCPPLSSNSTQVPQVNEVTYLGVHLDRRITWRRHIERQKVHLKLKASSFHWILNARSLMRLDYKSCSTTLLSSPSGHKAPRYGGTRAATT